MQPYILNLLKQNFPYNHIKYCFAYGSAVFKQAEIIQEKQQKVIDLIIVVDDTMEFHRKNMKTNKKHYSSLGR